MVRGAYSEVHSLYNAKCRGYSATAVAAPQLHNQESIFTWKGLGMSASSDQLLSSKDRIQAASPSSELMMMIVHGSAVTTFPAAELRPDGLPPPPGQYTGLKSVLR
jgi:hypothetical protein